MLYIQVWFLMHITIIIVIHFNHRSDLYESIPYSIILTEYVLDLMVQKIQLITLMPCHHLRWICHNELRDPLSSLRGAFLPDGRSRCCRKTFFPPMKFVPCILYLAGDRFAGEGKANVNPTAAWLITFRFSKFSYFSSKFSFFPLLLLLINLDEWHWITWSLGGYKGHSPARRSKRRTFFVLPVKRICFCHHGWISDPGWETRSKWIFPPEFAIFFWRFHLKDVA